jgi:hypothetical protein
MKTSVQIKRFFLLFLPTFLFLTLFSGLYRYLQMNYLNTSYEWISFKGNQPSDFDIIVMGFRNFPKMIFSAVISCVFSFLGGQFLRSRATKTNTGQRVISALILTLFLGGLHLICNSLYVLITGWEYLKSNWEYNWPQIKESTYLINVFYFIIALFLTYVLTRLSKTLT